MVVALSDLSIRPRRGCPRRVKCGHSRMLKHIAEFFALEKDIRGRGAEERRLIRQQRGRPLADAFQKWLRTKRGLISQKGKCSSGCGRNRSCYQDRRRSACRFAGGLAVPVARALQSQAPAARPAAGARRDRKFQRQAHPWAERPLPGNLVHQLVDIFKLLQRRPTGIPCPPVRPRP